MKLKIPDNKQHRPRINSREVLVEPEVMDSAFRKLVELIELKRQEALKYLINQIHIVESGEYVFGNPSSVAYELNAAQVLGQLFNQSIIPSELQQRALTTLRSSTFFPEFKQRVKQPRFQFHDLSPQASMVQLFPEDRATLGMTDEVFDEWLRRFESYNDKQDGEQPYWLAYLAQIRPDRKTECREMLQKIGFTQDDLGEEIWANREAWIRAGHEDTPWALVGIRLLQPERCLNDSEKQSVLRGFHNGPLNEYVNLAILLAPRVDIDMNGRVNLLSNQKSMTRSPKLPDRLGV